MVMNYEKRTLDEMLKEVDGDVPDTNVGKLDGNPVDIDKAVEPERKPGKWIEHKHVEETYQGHLVSNYECDQCHEWVMDPSNYCLNCGAKMEVNT